MENNFKLEYADAISEFEKILKKFNLKRKIYKLLFDSRSLEFEQYREYNENEDANTIDWSASSRANKLLARQYIEEREINFFFVVDISKNMLFGSKNKLKAEYAADITLSLANIIISSSDNAGLITFNEDIINYLPPSNLKKQTFIMQEYLSELKNYKKNAEFQKAFEHLFNVIKKRNTLVIIISDFLNPTIDMEKNLRLLSAKCEVMAIAVRDPLDIELPDMRDLLVLNNDQGSSMIIDPKISKNAYKKIVNEQLTRVRKTFQNTEVDFLELITDKAFVIPIVNFLQERSTGGEHGTII